MPEKPCENRLAGNVERNALLNIAIQDRSAAPRWALVKFQIDIDRLRAVADGMVRLGGDFALVGGAIRSRISSTAQVKRQRRNASIIELCEVHYSGMSHSAASVAIARELSRFASSQWRRVRELPDAPTSFQGTKNALLFQILSASGRDHSSVIRQRQIRSILARVQRQSGALDIAKASVARLKNVQEI